MPAWTIEQIEEALRECDGDLGVCDGVQFRVSRTDDEGGGYRIHAGMPGASATVEGVKVFLPTDGQAPLNPAPARHEQQPER